MLRAASVMISVPRNRDPTSKVVMAKPQRAVVAIPAVVPAKIARAALVIMAKLDEPKQSKREYVLTETKAKVPPKRTPAIGDVVGDTKAAAQPTPPPRR